MANWEYSQHSARCTDIAPHQKMSSSADVGWTSVLLEHVRRKGEAAAHDTPVTPDVTIVLATKGEHSVDVYKNGEWRRAIYQAGRLGMTPAKESTRLKYSARSSGSFGTAHLYIPQDCFLETLEQFRRAGMRSHERPLSALIYRDDAIAHTVNAMVAAISAGAPNLYAEQAAMWLATHLLSEHVRWIDVCEDGRSAGTLTDARLLRVREYISAHFGEQTSMDALAREAGISKFHFARLFKEKIGLSPHAYLTRVRMVSARRFLNHTDLPIATVASLCGYSSSGAFSKAYVRHHGVLPAASRAGSNGYYLLV